MAEHKDVESTLKSFLENLLVSFLGSDHRHSKLADDHPFPVLDSLVYKDPNERPFKYPFMILFNITAALSGLSGKLDKFARKSPLQSSSSLFGRQNTQLILEKEMSVSDMIELCGSLTRAWTRQEIKTEEGFERALYHVLGRHMPVVSSLTSKAYQTELEKTRELLQNKLQTAGEIAVDADNMEAGL